MVKMTMWNNCLVITIVWTFLTCTCSQVFLQGSNVCKNPRNELNSITEKFRQYFIENKNKLEQMEGSLLERQEIFENRLDKRVSEIGTAVEQLQNQEEQKRRRYDINCKKIMQRGITASGVYTIYLESQPVDVYCDMDTAWGGWTVIMAREHPPGSNNGLNFNRTWSEYKAGFGDVSEEHWLGNEDLHRLTQQQEMDVYLKLQKESGEWVHASYANFTIGPESDNYRLRFKSGSFKGSAGLKAVLDDDAKDVLPWKRYNHNNQSFSTWDQDNDRFADKDCANEYAGGWWFNACHSTLLTGTDNNIHHSFWSRVIGRLKSAVMMVRPAE